MPLGLRKVSRWFRKDDAQYIRQYRNWHVVLPLDDGRECPDCRVPVVGEEACIAHIRKHETDTEWANQVVVALHRLCAVTGLTVAELPREDDSNDSDDDDPPAALDGVVIGSGTLPAEMTGGAD